MSVRASAVSEVEPTQTHSHKTPIPMVRYVGNRGTLSIALSVYPAVHVEALERRDSNYSSLLDVIILGCWELESNVCPEQSHVKYSIPICCNCTLDFSGGKEYLIAGRHVQDVPAVGMGLYLPNHRKGGLCAAWKKAYSRVSEWVLAANGID